MKKLILGSLWSALAFGAIEDRINWLMNEPLTGLPRFESAAAPTVASAKLGRLLFYDKRLSGDGTVSCSSCHSNASAFSNQLAVPIGIHQTPGKRKAPPILNRAFSTPFFWDGRAASLEEQATGPLFDPGEMGTNAEKLVATVSEIRGYRPLFVSAFGSEEISVGSVTRAIADFERTLLSGDSKFDRWEAKDPEVTLTDVEKRGHDIFLDRSCHECHKPPFYEDGLFHNTGLGFKDGVFTDVGRFAITKVDADTGAFKTPTLRGLSKHAPYMHDGSLKSLEEVVEFYNKGGIRNPHLSEKILPLGLQAEDKKALLAFLLTLEGHGWEETTPLPAEFPL